MMLVERRSFLLLFFLIGFGLIQSTSSHSISAGSRAGQRLLKNARLLNEEEDDGAWIAEMSLKFEACYNTVILNEDGGGGDGGGSPIQNRGVITFRLCATGCDQCKGGIYATNLFDFVDAYTESRMEMEAYQCEKAREDCNCDNADDQDACEQLCWYELGMMYCIQDDNNNNGNENEQFEVQRYLECAEMEVNNNNDDGNGNGYANGYNGYQVYNNWDGAYRVGPYCAADGESIYLGVFYDEDCTLSAGDGAYASLNSALLPYSAKSSEGPLVPLEACVSCLDQEAWDEQNGNNNNGNNNYNGNQWNNMEPLEFCLNAWDSSAKCNENDRSGCHFINKFLKMLSGKGGYVKYVGAPNNNGALLFAWLFGFTTLLFGAYSFYLYKNIKLDQVELRQEPTLGIVTFAVVGISSIVSVFCCPWNSLQNNNNNNKSGGDDANAKSDVEPTSGDVSEKLTDEPVAVPPQKDLYPQDDAVAAATAPPASEAATPTTAAAATDTTTASNFTPSETNYVQDTS